jgi:hypothetical protein
LKLIGIELECGPLARAWFLESDQKANLVVALAQFAYRCWRIRKVEGKSIPSATLVAAPDWERLMLD